MRALPGGDMPGADFDAFLVDARRAHPWLPADLARRYARAYGTRLERVSMAPGTWAAWASIWATACMRPRSTTWSATSGR